MERFGEGARGIDPRETYPGEPYPREVYPMATQLNRPYEYYPGEATLRPPPVAPRPPWSLGMLMAGGGAGLLRARAALVPLPRPTVGYTPRASAAWQLTS